MTGGLRNRPSRCPSQTRLLCLESGLRVLEYTRAKPSTEDMCRQNEAHGEIAIGLRRDLLSPNHGRGFRILPIFSGCDVSEHRIQLGVV